MKNKYIILGLIVILGIFLRFWNISTNPPSLYWDEVSQGYNAYSILKTGHDEHGEFLPIARFIAYGDYKAPVYIYLDVPFIALFGRTALAVRFPSALVGSLTVLVVFFLVRELFFYDKRKDLYALVSSFLLGISPWHIQLSRAAYEGNIATFFTILGVYLFFLAKRKYEWVYVLSGLSFVIGIYAFNAFRVFIPLLCLLLLILYAKNLWLKKKVIITTVVVCFIILIPFIQFLLTPESKLRFNEVNIFSDTRLVEKANEAIMSEGNTLVANVIHNRRIYYSIEYLKHYFDFFNLDFLFIRGDVNPRFSHQENGELYLWELPLILAGAYLLITSKKKEAIFIFGWLFLAPIAGATARETPHALRGETFLPIYELFSALGAVFIFTSIYRHSRKIAIGISSIFAVVVGLSLFLFQYKYFIDYPYLYSEVWQDGYKSTIEKVKRIENQYDKIVVTNTYGRPYAYVLFYGDILPEEIWTDSDVRKDQFGLYNVYRVGKYYFPEEFSVEKDVDKKVLYVGAPNEIPNGAKIIDTINFINGNPSFILVTH